MTNRTILAMFVAIAVGSCSSSGPDNTDLSKFPPVITLSDFTDGTWKLQVDRRWDSTIGQSSFPTDPLDETWYVPIDSGPVYPIVISDQGLLVTISASLKGQRVSSSDAEVLYDIIGGTFAGGRFVARSTTSGLQGELTIYGSGVPVIKSERGPLMYGQ